MNLQGTWRFGLDAKDAGIREKWYNKELDDHINVSGILQAQGYGEDVNEDTPFVEGLHDRLWPLREEMQDFTEDGQVLVPFLSQPVKHFLGAAWFQREIVIPEEWEGKQIELFMELVRWKSTVWIDDTCYGDYTSLCVPHRFQLGQLSTGSHTLTVRVDNRMLYHYRPDAHGVTDSVGHTWNGIVGRVELIPHDIVSIQKVAVYPDYLTKTVEVELQIKNSGEVQKCKISATKTLNLNSDKTLLVNDKEDLKLTLNQGVTETRWKISLGEEAILWDEFTPALQQLELIVSTENDTVLDKKSVCFGIRNIKSQDRHFILNGHVISFRGTHDAGCFPKTGYPAYDLEEWRRICSICKNWGLNHIRFHSWCPPEAAFQAADEAGIYLQIETGMWNYFIQGGEIENELYQETDRILEAFGNHPSFLLMSSGNEPHGQYKPIVNKWVATYRKTDNRHLYCTQSGWFWPAPPEDPHCTDYYYTCTRNKASRMRGRGGWFGKDYQEYIEDIDAPFLCHELGQYCSYPDFSVIDKFTGYLRPGNYKGFRNMAKRHGLLKYNKDFVEASGYLQQLAYKEEIEANLRTPAFSGFSLLDLHDYLGQGGALIGMLDAFWDPKPYADIKGFRKYCSPTVVLARIPKVNYRADEVFKSQVEVACYDKYDYQNAIVEWKVKDQSGKVYLSGTFDQMQIKSGENTAIGELTFSLDQLPAPNSYDLTIGIQGTEVENCWKIYLYPAAIDCSTPDGIQITETLSDTIDALEKGKKVLFLPRTENLHYNSPKLSAIPAFWNGRMGPKWSRGLGMWCDVEHGALKEFPTASGAGWQWMDILENSRGMNVEGLPDELQPFLCPIDDWNRSYRLALGFEANLNGGKLLVCSANFRDLLKQDPATAQLLHSILDYMNSANFAPSVSVTEDQIKTFLFDATVMRRNKVNVKVVEGIDHEENISEENQVSNIIDGDPNTYWLAGGKNGGNYPFTVEFETEEPVSVKGLLLMPRQNHRDWEGQVKSYEVLAEQSGQWIEVCKGELAASCDAKEIMFPEKLSVTRLRLRLLEGFGAENVLTWQSNSEVGFYSELGAYQDQCVSMSEVDYICDDLDESGMLQIDYSEGATATKEIY